MKLSEEDGATGTPLLTRHSLPDLDNTEGSTDFTVWKPLQDNFKSDWEHGQPLLIVTLHTGFCCTTSPVLGCLCFGVKYYLQVKIFSNVWLHFKNYIRKQFSMFGNILKMLFSSKFFTFSQSFSQLPNKFYITKSTITHRKSTTIHTKPTTTQQKNY